LKHFHECRAADICREENKTRKRETRIKQAEIWRLLPTARLMPHRENVTPDADHIAAVALDRRLRMAGERRRPPSIAAGS
jgi:hypothetical protein